MPYQGHLPDGSSIQRHSAGTHYPFIVGKQEGQLRPWFVMEPSGKIIDRQVECRVAFENAEHLAKVRRERQAKTAAVYVAATDSVVQVPLNMKPAALANPGRTYPPMDPPRYPDGWGVV